MDTNQTLIDILMQIGAMKQQIEDLQTKVAALESRSGGSGNQNAGGKWEKIGDSQHTITSIARAKSQKGDMFLLLWSKGAKFAISYYWWNDKDKKDEILKQIEELSGVAFGKMPWINDLKADNLQSLMAPCKEFILHQVIKERGEEGAKQKKYFITGFSAPNQQTTPQTPPPAQQPKPAKPAPGYNVDAKLLEAWKKYSIPEAKARLIMKDIVNEDELEEVMVYLAGRVMIDSDLYEKGFIVPARDADRSALYSYGKSMYGLDEAQVKKIFRWLGKAQLQKDVGGMSIDDLPMWKLEYAIDLAHVDAKK